MVLPVAATAASLAAKSAAGAGFMGSLGSMLGTAGSFLGGLGGLFGGKKKRGPSFDDQLVMEGQLIDRRMNATMQSAKKYGIHPLYALGAPLSGGMSFDVGGNDATRDLAEVGQNFGAALHRISTKEDRAFGAATAQLALERGHLENELLKSQIAQINASMNPPLSVNGRGQLIPGQEQSGVLTVPNEIIARRGGDEAGDISSYTEADTLSGKMRIPSKDFQDRAEDIPLIGWEWLIRNRLLPGLSNLTKRKPGQRRYKYGRGSQ